MLCSGCYKEISECDFCGLQFSIDDDIICMSDGEDHFCEICLDKWLEDHHNWSKTTVKDKEE